MSSLETGESKLGMNSFCLHLVPLTFVRYDSPYPLGESQSNNISTYVGNRVSKRISHTLSEEQMGTIWVCDRCFKYMARGGSWELHTVNISIIISASRNVMLCSIAVASNLHRAKSSANAVKTVFGKSTGLQQR